MKPKGMDTCRGLGSTNPGSKARLASCKVTFHVEVYRQPPVERTYFVMAFNYNDVVNEAYKLLPGDELEYAVIGEVVVNRPQE